MDQAEDLACADDEENNTSWQLITVSKTVDGNQSSKFEGSHIHAVTNAINLYSCRHTVQDNINISIGVSDSIQEVCAYF